MKPSDALARHRDAVLEAVRRYSSANPRVIGATLTGEDRGGSDLDLLVDPLARRHAVQSWRAPGGCERDPRRSGGCPDAG